MAKAVTDPPRPTGVRVTLNYSRAKFVCLEGKDHRAIEYSITTGDSVIEADVCFDRLAIGNLYWPPRSKTTCP